MPLGDVGDDDPPPQAENNVASVAPEAAWQAPAQKRRRETAVFFVSDIAEIPREAGESCPRAWGKIEATRQLCGFSESAGPGWWPPITDCGGRPVIS
jgi:hypothetical protein